MGTLRLHRHGAPPLEVTQDRTLVGRDPACEMVIEDKSVSRRHAFFERRGPAWAVVDQGSANGTFVNGAQVTDAELRDGQELRLGMVALRVEIESAMAGTVLMDAPIQGTVMMPGAGAAPAAWGAPPPPAYAQPQPSYAPVAPQPQAPPSAPYAPPPPAAPYTPPPSPYAQPAASQAPSPQEEAAALLGVHVRATPDEVKARYSDLSSDLQTKLANARTPHLKSTYQRNLDELRKAAELLSPGFTTVDTADLPAAAPTVIPDELDMSIPAPVRAAMAEKPPEAAEPKSGLPPTSTVILGFTAMLLLAASAFLNLSAGKLRKERDKKMADPAIVQEQKDAERYKAVEALAAARVLDNGTLKLCNKGTQTFEASWVGAVYAATDDAGKPVLNSFNSGWCGSELRVAVPAGAEQTVDIKGSDPRCRWDGKGLFYAIAFKDPKDPEKQLRVTGPLHRQTACVNIGEGW